MLGSRFIFTWMAEDAKWPKIGAVSAAGSDINVCIRNFARYAFAGTHFPMIIKSVPEKISQQKETL
ncbi:MAG: hypothetical protein R2932_55625 [Caldilineaceae bacterium]